MSRNFQSPAVQHFLQGRRPSALEAARARAEALEIAAAASKEGSEHRQPAARRTHRARRRENSSEGDDEGDDAADRAWHSFAAASAAPPDPVDPDTLMRLALAVAAPGAEPWYLDEQNERDGSAGSVEEAFASCRPYAPPTRGDLFVTDSDLPRATPFLWNFIDMLEGDGFLPTVWGSGRDGHVRIVVRILEEFRPLYSMIAGACRLFPRAAGEPIRPPLSPHRLGQLHHGGLLHPDTLVEALSSLEAPPVPSAIADPARQVDPWLLRDDIVVVAASARPLWRQISRDVEAKLYEDGYGISAPAVLAFADSALQRGWARNEIRDVVAGTPAGRRMWRELDKLLDKAGKFILKGRASARPPAPDAAGALAAAQSAIEAFHWPKRRRSLRRVAQALLEIARGVGKTEIYASERDIMLKARYSGRTVRRALNDLLNGAGPAIFERAAPADPSASVAATIRIVLAPNSQTPGSPVAGAAYRIGGTVCVLSSASIFSLKGLKGFGADIYQVLKTPLSAQEIAAAVGCTDRTVRNVLKLMLRFGLAVRTGRGVWERGPADLDGMAALHGAVTLQEDREAEIERQRDAFRERMENEGLAPKGGDIIALLTGHRRRRMPEWIERERSAITSAIGVEPEMKPRRFIEMEGDRTKSRVSLRVMTGSDKTVWVNAAPLEKIAAWERLHPRWKELELCS